MCGSRRFGRTPPPPPKVWNMFDWTDCAATLQQQARLVSVLEQFNDVLAKNSRDMGYTPISEHNIDMGLPGL